MTTPVLDLDIPFIRLAPFEASAPAKIRLALRRLPWEAVDGDTAPIAGRIGEHT